MSNDKILHNLGVDLNSSFTFHDGDITLSNYDDNLVQAICNRLNTRLDELRLFYQDYGSVFRDFLGWHGNDETLGFMSGELETVLLSENRVKDWDFDISYRNGKVVVNLNLKPDDDYSIDVVLELGNNGVEVIS